MIVSIPYLFFDFLRYFTCFASSAHLSHLANKLFNSSGVIVSICCSLQSCITLSISLVICLVLYDELPLYASNTTCPYSSMAFSQNQPNPFFCHILSNSVITSSSICRTVYLPASFICFLYVFMCFSCFIRPLRVYRFCFCTALYIYQHISARIRFVLLPLHYASEGQILSCEFFASRNIAYESQRKQHSQYYQRDDPAKCHIHPSISFVRLSAPSYTRFAGKEQQPAAHFLCRVQPMRLPGGNVARPAVGAPFLQPEKVFRKK